MHVPLDEHLHTEECNIIIRDLKRCHEETSLFSQFFGGCNQLDWAMRACTRKERLARTAENRDNAHKRQAEVQKKMGELKSADWRENLREKLDSKQ